MSVINDMLRDLESRKAPERSSIKGAVEQSLIEPQSALFSHWRVTVIIAALALLGGILFYAYQNLNFAALEPDSNDVTQKPVPGDAALASALSTRSDDNPGPENNKTATAVSMEERIQQNALVEPLVDRPEIISGSAKAPATKSANPEVVAKVLESKEPVSESKQKRDQQSGRSTDPVVFTETSENLNQASTPVRQISSAQQPVKAAVSATAVETDKPVANETVTLSDQTIDAMNATQALEDYQAGDRRDAIRSLYRFIESHSVDTASRSALARLLYQEGRLAEAGDILVTLSGRGDPDLRQVKARWQVASGNPEIAIYTLASELPDLGDYPEYFALLASYYQQYGYSQKAADTYTRLVGFDARQANWWAGLAIAFDSLSDFDSARNAYQQAVRLPGLKPELLAFSQQRLRQLKK